MLIYNIILECQQRLNKIKINEQKCKYTKDKKTDKKAMLPVTKIRFDTKKNKEKDVCQNS